ncbi:MAG: HNH endonuclease [Candidatus Binatia bacterium]
MARWIADVSAETIKRERAQARALRQSAWWKRRRASGVCHYCGQRVPPRELTMDHLVPLSRGGRSTKGNLVPACKACNTKKRQRLVFEVDLEERAALRCPPHTAPNKLKAGS